MLIYVARAYYLGSKVFHCMNILLFILLIDIWVVFSPEILQTCCHEHFYSCLLVHVFLLIISLKVEILCHMVPVSSALVDNSK